MAINYVDPDVILARYQAGEPIVDDFVAVVVEGLQYMWRRHVASILSYVPRTAFETTSATATRTNESTADYTEDLNVYPSAQLWRPDDGGAATVDVTAFGGLIVVTITARDSTGWSETDTITLGAGPTSGAIVLDLTGATDMVWFDITAHRNGGSGTGTLSRLYIHSNYLSDAPI
jgi:hypothetical protein